MGLGRGSPAPTRALCDREDWSLMEDEERSGTARGRKRTEIGDDGL